MPMRKKATVATKRSSVKAKQASKSPKPRGAAPLRERLFDDGWRFLRGDAPGAECPDFDDASWRAIDLPHDWSLEDLPPDMPPANATPMLAVIRATWRFKKGDDPAWKAPDLDESDWETVNMPGTWEEHSNYTQDNVYGWYRRRVTIPPSLKGKDLVFLLGRIDDVDEAFVNGVRIGGRGQFPPDYKTAYYERREYPVKASLLRGDGSDVLAVRVFDGPGSGGLIEAPSVPEEAVRIGPFDSHVSPGGRDTGYVLGGVGWYRKRFKLPAAQSGKTVSIRFDGVYMNSDVWINGQPLGNHPYGYTSFAYDLTPFLKPPGQANVLAVRVRNIGRNSRWYSGSGIYRHTWLTVAEALHVGLWGVFVTTPEVSDERALVRVATTVDSVRPASAAATVRVSVLGPAGKVLAQASGAGVSVGAGASATIEQTVTLKNPRRWSLDDPHLYTAQVEIVQGTAIVDCVRVAFGVRTFSFDARSGFMLNGATLKLKGACMHHDNGPLGAATIDRAEQRRVEIMKANGYNAIRTAHNPPSPAFLDACDRLGVLVLDESFDAWQVAKNPDDYHRYFDAWWQRDTDSMVLRDRNHPSVVVWSIGNEIMEQNTPAGAELAWRQANRVRALDPTRPVTSALSGLQSPTAKPDPFFAALDVAGCNYAQDLYVRDHAAHPFRVMLATESFPLQAFEYWMGVLDHPYVAGDFVWTGMDYFGESGIGFAAVEGDPTPVEAWPYHGATCGDIDVCGFKRPQSYYRDVLWGRSKLEMAVHRPLPEGKKEWLNQWAWPDQERSWTWPACEGKPLRVSVYSSAQQVRLGLNGRQIGLQSVSRDTRLTACFEVPYEPGELRAEALTDGRVVATAALRTAGQPAKLRLAADRARIAADRNDLAFVTVEVLDRAGTIVPQAVMPVHFRLSGPGELAAVGNGDPRHAASFRQPQCVPFRGRCLAVVRPKGKAGTIVLRAEAQGLTPADLKLTTQL